MPRHAVEPDSRRGHHILYGLLSLPAFSFYYIVDGYATRRMLLQGRGSPLQRRLTLHHLLGFERFDLTRFCLSFSIFTTEMPSASPYDLLPSRILLALVGGCLEAVLARGDRA